MANITFSKSSGLNNSVYGQSYEPIKMMIEKKAEAFDSALASFTRFLNDSFGFSSGICFEANTENSVVDKWISSNCADMYFPDITSSMKSSIPAGDIISAYASLAKEYDARIYCVLHNEKTATGGDWTEDDEIY